MARIKKAALVLAVVLVVSIGAGWVLFNAVADMVVSKP